MEGVYLIKDKQSGLHKIGMTTNWPSRKRQLQVGPITTEIKFVQCRDSRKWERVLHNMFKHKRLPQSEWFRITEEEAIPKMNWLASQTTQNMIIGGWKIAAAGNYYRRRKSSSGNWYTEQKSAHDMRREQEQILESRIRYQEAQVTTEARREAGYWPTKADPNKIEWQPSDPTRQQFNIWIPIAILLGLFLLANIGNNSNNKQPSSKERTVTVQPEQKVQPMAYKETFKAPKQDTRFTPKTKSEPIEPDCDSIALEIYNLKDSQTAVELYGKHKVNCNGTNIKENTAWHFNELGVIAANNDLHGIALTHYLDSYSLNKKDPQVITNIADAYIFTKEYNNAIYYANLALDINSSFASAFLTRGLAYTWKDNIPAACNDFNSAHTYGDKAAAQLAKESGC